MREWLVKAGLEEESTNLELLFYAARYHDGLGSIFAMGDLAALASFALYFLSHILRVLLKKIVFFISVSFSSFL